MSMFFWLPDDQMAGREPDIPKPHGKPRVDDPRVLPGMIFIIRSGLSCCDAPKALGPHEARYNRWTRWGETGMCARIPVGLSAEPSREKTAMMDATYLQTHRTATSLWVEKRRVDV
jgi:transposase